MRVQLLASYFLIFFAIASFTACSNQQGQIEGKWVLTQSSGNAINDPNNYLILKADGSAIENNGSGENARTWNIKDDNLCIKALDSDGGIETCGNYELKDKVLIVEMSDLGVKMEYHKQ